MGVIKLIIDFESIETAFVKEILIKFRIFRFNEHSFTDFGFAIIFTLLQNFKIIDSRTLTDFTLI